MDFLESVFNAGIVGEGGAGFPTHVKLKAKAEWFIVNAAECEPLIETDKFLCRTFPEEIINGILAVGKQLEAKYMVIALKGKYKNEITALNQAIKKLNAPVEIFEMRTFYPAGDEQTMVQQVINKSIPERGLPLDVGAVVDNVGTVIKIWEGLNGKSVTRKTLSVVGEVPKPTMLDVPIGTAIKDCINWAKGKDKDVCVIIGGPMMGSVLTSEEEIEKAVVTKTTGNIILLPKDHYLINRSKLTMERIKKQTNAACIQCQMCTDLCPRYLIGHNVTPHLVMRNLFKEEIIIDDKSYINAFGSAVNCCDCGICEMFACPMGLSPRKVMGYFKQRIRKKVLTDLPRNTAPTARDMCDMRKIPTGRLIARLGLSKYESSHVKPGEICNKYMPKNVCIPMRMHIGAPALPVVSIGEFVKVGDLIGKAAAGLSANIHSSVNGTITKIDNWGIEISVKEG